MGDSDTFEAAGNILTEAATEKTDMIRKMVRVLVMGLRIELKPILSFHALHGMAMRFCHEWRQWQRFGNLP